MNRFDGTDAAPRRFKERQIVSTSLDPTTPELPLPGGAPSPPPTALPEAAVPSEGTVFVRAKDSSIETLRGLAIVLMVLGHVIGDTASSGLNVAEDSLFRYWYFSTSYLRMPLFTVISGYVYAMRPVQPGTAGRFLRGKARRLLVPLLTVGTLQYVLKGVVPGVNHATDLTGLWQAHLYGFDQFWFLQALLTVFVTIAVLEELELTTRVSGWLVCFSGAVLASRYLPKADFFSLWGYLYLLPYFLLGCGFRRFGERVTQSEITAAAALLLAGGMFVQQMIWFGGWNLPLDLFSWTSLSVGLGGTYLLMRFRPNVPVLAWLGAYSFSIYLFHVFPAAASRIVLRRLGIDEPWFLASVGLLCGLALPIGVELVVRRRGPLLQVLFGTR